MKMKEEDDVQNHFKESPPVGRKPSELKEAVQQRKQTFSFYLLGLEI